MILAVEDSLSEVVATKILSSIRPDIEITLILGKQGNGYLKNKAKSLNATASKYPVFLLADLDRPTTCPSNLIAHWLGGPAKPYLFFRIAVFEIESWVLAHRDAFSDFLSISLSLMPIDTDAVSNPKEFLISLARRSRQSEIKRDLVPRPGGTSTIGPAYNSRLSEFVNKHWDPIAATSASNSLKRTVERLRTFLVPF